jgi:hypothetical protein
MRTNLGDLPSTRLIAAALAAFALAMPIPARGSVQAEAQHTGAAMACPAHATVEEASPLREPGQAIFGALREVLDRLEADPATDWTRVDLDALREHLVQMDLLFREAQVVREPLADGMRYAVRGGDEVLAAARSIGAMHARMLSAEAPSWQMRVETRGEDVVFEVRSSDPEQQAKIRGLGFSGLLTLGAHHAQHHWAMATGHMHHH